MATHLEYLVVRQQQAELARQAERARQTRAGEPHAYLPRALAGAPRHGRLAGLMRLVRPDQRELALPPRGDERIPIAAACLEIE
jgi:hypothetical protein